MKTYECIAHSGNTGKQIFLFVRAYSASSARALSFRQDSSLAPVLAQLQL